MRETVLIARTVLGLLLREHGPVWRRRGGLIARWAMAILAILVVAGWCAWSFSFMDRLQEPWPLAPKDRIVVVAILLVGLLGAVMVVVNALLSPRDEDTFRRARLGLVLSDPHAMIEFAVGAAVEQTVDGRGWDQWRGLGKTLVLMAGWMGVIALFGLAVVLVFVRMLTERPRWRLRKALAAAAKRREERRLNPPLSAFQRWSRTVLERHPDAARELEGRILRQVLPKRVDTSRARTRL